MPKVSQSHRDARRSQILDAALACFTRQGFHRTTMQDIVAQARLSPGAIYTYFAGKEEIIEAIADDRHSVEQELIADAQQETHIIDVLQRIRDAFFSQLTDPRERRRRRVSIQLWAEAQRSPRVRAIVRRSFDQPRSMLRALLVAAQRRHELPCEIDPDATARLMIAAFHGIVLQLDWDEDVAVAPYVELLDLCLQRLVAPANSGGLRPARRASTKQRTTQEASHGEADHQSRRDGEADRLLVRHQKNRHARIHRRPSRAR